MFSSKSIFILAFFVLFPATAFPDTILIKSDIWCPYNCAPDAELPGYIIEISKIIFERAGHRLLYETAPWSRSLRLVQEGNITAIVGVTKNEAPGLVFPEQEFGISVIQFFKRKGFVWKFAGTASLKKVRVGIMGDYEYGAELDAYFEKNADTPNVQIIRAKEPLVINIRKLLRERIDVIPEDKSVFTETARSMGVLDKIENAGIDPIRSKKDLEDSKLYIAFSPENPQSKGYAKLITDGLKADAIIGRVES